MFLPVEAFSKTSARSGAPTNPTTSGADGLAKAEDGHVVNRAKLRMNWLLSVSSDCARTGAVASTNNSPPDTAEITARRTPGQIVTEERIAPPSQHGTGVHTP